MSTSPASASPSHPPSLAADDRPSTLSLSSPLEIQEALAAWKRDWAQIHHRRRQAKAAAAATSSPAGAATATAKSHAGPPADTLLQSHRHSALQGSGSGSLSRHSSPHSSPPGHAAHIRALFASTITPPDSPVTPLVPTASPPRSKHGLRLQAAAQAQIEAAAAAAAKSKLPVKRKLAEQLGAVSSPLRTAATAAASSAPSTPLTPFGMTMLRSPAAAASAAASSSPGGTGSTPSKRHRLDAAGVLPSAYMLGSLPNSPFVATSAGAAAASSPPAAARPSFSTPRPASPPAARSAPRSAGSRPSPSKKNLFGAMLSGQNSLGLTSGKPKRLRDAAALTPGLHHSKGIFSYTMGDATSDDRAKKAEAIRAYEEWMESRRKADAAKQREEQAARNRANPIQLHHDDEDGKEAAAAEEEEDDDNSSLQSDAEDELLITPPEGSPTSTAVVSITAAAAAASSSSSVAARASIVSAAVVVAPAAALSASSLVPLVPFSAFAALLTPTALAMQSVLDPASMQAQADIILEPLSSPDGDENL